MRRARICIGILALLATVNSAAQCPLTLVGAGSCKISAAANPGNTDSAHLLWWYSVNCVNAVGCGSQPSDGDNVAQLKDRSSNGNDLNFNQSHPIFHTNQLNGQPGLAITSTTSGTFTNAIAWSGAETVFFVFKVTTVTNQNSFVGGAGSGTALLYYIETSKKQSLYNGTLFVSGTSTLSSGTYYQANVTYNSSTGAWSFRVARGADGSGTNTATISNSQLGLPGQGFFVTFTGTFVESFGYSVVESGGNISALEGYLNGEYAI